MAIKANTLFHFTPKKEHLFDILENGFWPRYCREDVSWIKDEDHKFVAYPMVCFCDIPLSKILEHTKFYGKFGIGMTREWAVSYELSPVWYVSDRTDLSKKIKSIGEVIKLFKAKYGPLENFKDMGNSIDNFLCYLLSYIKPISGKMEINKKIISKKFDEESEWRYVPNNKHIRKLILDSSSINLEEENKKTKQFSSLMFEPKDIKYIFVPKDSDIPGVAKKIQALYLEKYDYADTYLLISKIISLDTISEDL